MSLAQTFDPILACHTNIASPCAIQSQWMIRDDEQAISQARIGRTIIIVDGNK
jgi:hypothetical protein